MNADILNILKTKNRCLKRFLSWTDDFLVQAREGNFTDLTVFHQKREAILKALDLYDRKTGEAAMNIRPEDKTPIMIERIKMLLSEKELLVIQILEKDADVIECIENEKEKIRREIGVHQKAKENMSKFKSTWVPENGEEIDEKL